VNITATFPRIRVYVFLGILFIFLIVAFSITLPPAFDWHFYYLPAIGELLSGRSPYTITGFLNPPWTLIPLIPLYLMPEPIGRAVLATASIVVILYVLQRLHAKPIAIIAVLLSAPVFEEIYSGNMDWLAVLGFVLPPQIGLFFVLIKPQVGIGVAVYWLIETWRQGRLRGVIHVFLPVTLAYIASFLIFGLWPMNMRDALGWSDSFTFWPSAIPIGIGLLVVAIRRRDIRFSMGASPCLAPYVRMHSWIGALIAISESIPETIAVVVSLWILTAIQALF
jgi:hypothetical protein